jgi:hypothetical protein
VTDDQLREVRLCTNAVGQILTLAAMPKKTEAALRQVYTRLSQMTLPPPESKVGLSVAESNSDGLG